MRPTLRTRFWLEVPASCLALALALATYLSPAWIETLFSIDPDGGDGSLEWALVIGCLAVAAGLGVAARAEWRRGHRVVV